MCYLFMQLFVLYVVLCLLGSGEVAARHTRRRMAASQRRVGENFEKLRTNIRIIKFINF